MGWRLVLPLAAVPCPRPKLTRFGKAYYPGAYSKWKAAAARSFTAQSFDCGILKPLTGSLIVSIGIEIARPKKTSLEYPRGDIDNYVKSVLDAANGIVWEDDTQIVGLHATKDWSELSIPPQTLILVERL